MTLYKTIYYLTIATVITIIALTLSVVALAISAPLAIGISMAAVLLAIRYAT